MNKRHLHHAWTRLRLIKPWYFLLLAIICGAICLFALRANSQHMAKLRQDVYTADQADNDVQGALNRLQAYVTAHMNTDLSTGNSSVYPPIQLQYTYQRLVQQQSTQGSNNDDLYTQAQTYCQQLNHTDFSGHNRVPCIEQYVQQHGSGVSLTNKISPSLYQFDFVSPRWSPDLAGWTLVATVILFMLFVVTLIVDWRIKRLVR